MPLNRTERIIAFAVASVGGISIIAIVAVFVGRAANADFTNGAWRAVAALPLIGLPITLIALIAFMIMTTVRRNRLARDAGE